MNSFPIKRLFFAINLPTKIKRKLQDVQARIDQIPGLFRWVAGDNLHLTVLFLGDVPVLKLSGIFTGADEVVRRLAPFELRLEKLKILESQTHPRVVAVSVRHDTLSGLYWSLVEVLNSQGLQVKIEHSFDPHITLARFRAQSVVPAQLDLIMNTTVSPCSFPVKHVDLIESSLGSGLPVYSVLHQASLAGV